MAFRDGRRLEFLGQAQNDFLWNRVWTTLVLRQNGRERRLKINNLNSRAVISEKVNPALAHLPGNIGCAEREAASNAQMFTTFLTRRLDDLALVVCCFNVERFTNGVQRDDWNPRSVLG